MEPAKNVAFKIAIFIGASDFLSCLYRWKSLTRPPSDLKGLKHMDTIQDSKFFKSLASPKVANVYDKLVSVLCNIQEIQLYISFRN